ncbi:MAG: peptidase C11, partial [Planctomycetaceae bacterium]|nr:peptidase C11 [Planctomycetaceae bacterium]
MRITGHDNALNPNYTLRFLPPLAPLPDWAEENDQFIEAYDLGMVTGQRYWDGLSMSPSADDDWFKFTTSAESTSVHDVGIRFLHSLGDLDLELYNSGGVLLDSSTSVADLESISLDGLAAGEYFIRAFGYNGAINPSYQIKIQAPEPPQGDWAEENDTLAQAYELGTLNRPQFWTDLNIEASGDDDWFRFEMVNRGSFSHNAAIEFNQTRGDLDLELYHASGDLLRSSSTAAGLEQVSLNDLSAGDYYLRILGHNGDTSPLYSLSIDVPAEPLRDWAEDNDYFHEAYSLRDVEGLNTWGDLSVDPAGDDDWFSFTTIASSTSDHYVRIDFENSLGDLDFDLFDANGNNLGGSYGVLNQEQVTLQGLEAGTYFVRIYGRNDA